MKLIKYITMYIFLMLLEVIILIISWLIGIKNLIFTFFVEVSLLFLGDYLIKQRHQEDIRKIFINKFKFSEKRFDYFIKAGSIEKLFGLLFILCADISVICYPYRLNNLKNNNSLISILLVSTGLFFCKF